MYAASHIKGQFLHTASCHTLHVQCVGLPFLLTLSCPLQILWRQFLKFKETDLPSKEADKNQSKLQYQSLEVSRLQQLFFILHSIINFLCVTLLPSDLRVL